MKSIPKNVQEAFEAAQKVRENAYAPYSKLKVGSALKVKGVDELVVGCNVENTSYGATICSERFSFGQAIALHGKVEFEFLVLTSTSPSGVIPPCGMCLQFMQEFVGEDFPIYLGDKDQIREVVRFGQLLPYNFRADMLP